MYFTFLTVYETNTQMPFTPDGPYKIHPGVRVNLLLDNLATQVEPQN